MQYKLLKELVDLLADFESQVDQHGFSQDLEGFKRWITQAQLGGRPAAPEAPSWEGQELGRSAESVISTLLVHLGRYAKSYSKSAIYDSVFATQEDFIYLINLKAFGAMTKTDLIKKNIHEKPVGMQIINRLIKQDLVWQQDSQTDKRSKIIVISRSGLQALEERMLHIRKATQLVAGNLTEAEKLELIQLLQKLESFHQPIFIQNLDASDLLETVYEKYFFTKN